MIERNRSISVLTILMLAAVLGGNQSCSNSALEHEQVVRKEAEQKAEQERQLREHDHQIHETEKSRLWMYLFAALLLAVILLLVGTGLGSAALKDAKKAYKSDDKSTSGFG